MARATYCSMVDSTLKMRQTRTMRKLRTGGHAVSARARLPAPRPQTRPRPGEQAGPLPPEGPGPSLPGSEGSKGHQP